MKRFLVYVGFCLGAVFLLSHPAFDVSQLPLSGKLMVASVASVAIGWGVLKIMRGGYAE